MPIQLVIELADDKQIHVSGPIQNKILCYGLLEIAKDIIKNYKESALITPAMALPPILKD